MSDPLSLVDENAGLRTLLELRDVELLHMRDKVYDLEDALACIYEVHEKLLSWAMDQQPPPDLSEVLSTNPRDGLWNS